MTTVLQIITDSLQDAGIISAIETPSNADAQKAFRLLNRMLDGDSTEDLMIYNQVQEVFSLAAGNQTYTIGPSGNWNTTRPIDVTRMYMRDSNGNDLPVKMLSYEEYADILCKPITATLALSAWYNAGMPLSQITLWPIPQDTTYSAVVWSWKQISSFTSLSDTVILPPGYEDYIESNLTVRCCAAFNRPCPADIKEWAVDSKAKLKKINIDVPIMGFDTALVGGLNANTFPISPHIFTGY
jgi:hypothetical protein